MKKLLIGIISLSLFTACSNGTQKGNGAPIGVDTTKDAANAANAPKMKFDNNAFDFGKVNQGDKVTHEFKFTNVGKSPLIIKESFASCGCTTPEWPKSPVKPGDSGVIKVTFNSTGKSGLQDKQITVVGNTVPANTIVHLVGEVLEPTAKNTKK